MTSKDQPFSDEQTSLSNLVELDRSFEREFVQSLAYRIFEANPFPSLVLNRDAQIILINRTAREWIDGDVTDSDVVLPRIALKCVNALKVGGGCAQGEYCRNCELRAAINEVLKGSREVKRRHVAVRTEADGGESPLHLLVSAIELTQDSGRYILVTLEDITGHRRAELKERESKAELARAQEVAGMGSWSFDLVTHEIVCSRQLYRLYGIPLDSPVSSEDLIEHIHPDDRKLVKESWQRALDGGAYEVEYRAVVDDKTFWLRGCAEVEFDHKGEPVYATGTVQNITALHRANEAARRKEENFSTLFHTINDFLIVTDPNGIILHANKIVEQRLGYTILELVGKHASLLHPPELRDQVREYIGQMVRGERASCPIPLITKEGEYVHAESNITIGLWNGEPAIVGVTRDITIRHQVEEALRESESRFAAFADSVAEVLYRYDPINQAYEFISPAFKTQTGYEVSDLASDPRNFIKKITHPDDHERVMAEIATHFRKGPNAGPLVHEYRIVHKEGHTIWLRNTTVIEFDDQGVPMRVNGIVTDITEQKEAESALGRRDAILDAVSFAARQFLKEADWESSIDDFLAQLGGASEVGRTYIFRNSRDENGPRLTTLIYEWCDDGVESEMDNPELHNLDLHAEGLGRLADTLAAGEPCQLLEQEFTERERAHLEPQGIKSVLTVPIFVEDRWWGFIGFDDVHENRVWGTVEIEATKTAAYIISAAIQHSASRQALQESRERFRSLTANNPDQVTIYRSDGKILFAHSPEGSLPEMSLGKHVDQFVSDCLDPVRVAQIRDHVREALDSGRMQQTMYALATEGDIRYYEERFIPLGVDQVMSIMRDTTEREKTEQKLLKIQKLESVGVLAGGIAHDFNNILTGILGNVSLAMTQLDKESDAIELLSECENAVMRAKGLTHQLLTFSKGGQPVKRPMFISDLLQETVEFTLRGSNVKPIFELSENLPAVDIDPDQISQAIQNLVTNADQSMPDGGSLTIKADTCQIEKGASLPVPAGEYLRISFRDQGYGITKQNLQQVFDPYFTTKPTGSGLGLASCYSIISNHSGSIDVKSNVGEGSEFTILLPTSMTEPIAPEPTRRKRMTGSGRILFMDDEKSIRLLGQKTLQRTGYEVDLARDGTEALKMFKDAREEGHPYRAVILDLTIPGGMGGEETMQEMLKTDPDVRGIVCSGYSEHQLLTDHKRYGFLECVTKPFRANDLLDAVDRVVTVIK